MNKRVLVSGSIAYDRIMDFPGFFKDHILPDKIHMLNVSFYIQKIDEGFGGTAGNIAYNLSLLGIKPVLLGCVGEDFTPYERWLKKHNIDISKVKKFKQERTASAYIMTDQSDNQITGFYPGALDVKYTKIVEKIKNVDLAIISPDYEKRMVAYMRAYKKLNIPYIFDPGQQLTSLEAKDILFAVKNSKVVICNDYEAQMIMNKTKISMKDFINMSKMLIITKGGKGSEIFVDKKVIKIPPAKPENTCDPTGAGDAYRAGLIKGILEGYPLEKMGRLAGLVSVYTVEKYGTQTHKFTKKSLAERYKKNFGEKIII